MQGAVEVGAKRHAVVVEFSQVPEAKYLESATVGQNGSIKTHEPMQPSKLGDELVTGAQHQVVGVGEDHVRTQFVKVAVVLAIELFALQPLERRVNRWRR